MKWYNKETRNTQGEYYRRGDWSVEKPDDWDNGRGNFTTEAPPAECLVEGSNIPCDWNSETGQWEVDQIAKEKIEAQALLASTDIPAIRLSEDILEILVGKGVLSLEDLPDESKERHNARKTARTKIK